MRMRLAVGPLALLVAALPCPARAQAPLGPEFQIGHFGARPQAAGLASGFVVTWTGEDGLTVRRYSAAGTPLGAPFLASSDTSDYSPGRPIIDAAPDGRAVVVFESRRVTTFDNEVFARLFDAAGAPRGAEFQVNQTVAGFQEKPAVAMAADGSFVVAWQSAPNLEHEVFARRYDPNGSPLGGEFMVNTTTGYNESLPSVVADPSGGFIVTWISYLIDGSGFGIVARRFDAGGAPLTAEFVVNTSIVGTQASQAVAFDGAGNFLVAWSGSGETDDSGIFAQRFAADGTRLGGEFRVNRTNTNAEGRPSVAAESGGRYVVVWASTVKDGSGWGVFGQLVGGDGRLLDREFQVNTYTTGSQLWSDVASDGSGRLLVVWDGTSHDGTGSLEADGQLMGGLRPTALAVDAAGNGVAEPGETVTVAPTWLNTSGAALPLSGAVSAFGGPAGGTYTIDDGAASYGTLADGASASCGGNCYVVTTTAAARPSLHWDAALTETLGTGHHVTYPLHLGDSFADVPPASPYYRFVERLLHAGVTGGCSATAYCPAEPVTREQMAVFVLAGAEGSGYRPRECPEVGPFDDVPPTSPYCRWIRELARRGVVSGCGGGNYCPTDPVTREQMAVFVVRMIDPAPAAPACGTPVFSDVPATSVYCRWIEELFRRGVVTGCGNGRYCPTDPVSREQMAVFISATFGLTLYGP